MVKDTINIRQVPAYKHTSVSLSDDVQALLHVANAEVEYSHFALSWMVKIVASDGGCYIEFLDDSDTGTLEQWADALIRMKERADGEAGR